MHIKTFAGVYPNLAQIKHSLPSFFNKVKAAYPKLRKAGAFLQTPEAYFIYQIQGKKHSYTGVIACLDVRDFLEGRILRHERTLAAEEEKQMRFLLERRATVKPVLMTYSNAQPLDAWIADYARSHEPFLEIPLKKNETHRLWLVSEVAPQEALSMLFEEHVARVYIADGHHRTACSALLYKQLQAEENPTITYDRFLCALFPESELAIMEFNRVVYALDEMDAATLLKRLEAICTVERLKKKRKPRKKHEMTLFIGEDCYRLNWKQAVLDTYVGLPAVLDAALLNDKILKGILGIEDVRTDRRVSYVEGPKGHRALVQKIRKEPANIGFCLFPISASELFAVADAGEVLPPKSTWFEPRMKNGLLVQEF